MHIYLISFKMQNLSQSRETISREHKPVFLFDVSVLIQRNPGILLMYSSNGIISKVDCVLTAGDKSFLFTCINTFIILPEIAHTIIAVNL